MRNDDVQIKCFKCGNEYSMSMMRMDPTTKVNLVCKSCLDRKPVSHMKDSSAVSSKPAIQKTESKPKAQVQDTIDYFCKECRYSFKRAAHLHVKVCPYCSSSNGVMEKGSTDRIIADAANMKS